MSSSLVLSLWMFAALIRTVRKRAVPPQLLLADLRTVVSRHDAVLQRFKMSVSLIRICIRFTRPSARVPRIRQRVQQKVLLVARQITKRGFVPTDAFAVQISERVQECTLNFRCFC